MSATKAQVTMEQWAMGRDTEYPPSDDVKGNAIRLISRVNDLLQELDITVDDLRGTHHMDDNVVSSGYRPGRFNKAAGGALRSAHLTGEAIDIRDVNGKLARKIVASTSILRRLDLYMEAPARTKGWVHLQTRRIPSGNRIFQP